MKHEDRLKSVTRLVSEEKLTDVAEMLYNFHNGMNIKGIRDVLWQLVKQQDSISFTAGQQSLKQQQGSCLQVP